MRQSVFYIIVVFILACCTNAEKQKEEQLYKEVMAIHDEVMPQMGEVMRLEKALTVNIEQNTSDTSAINMQSKVARLTTLRQNLSDADDAMMHWMRQFNTNLDTMGHEQKIQYLQEEKEKIQTVKEQVNTAIQEAKEVLD